MDHLRTIRTFVSLAKHANVSKVAEELSISRALITRHLSDLETRLGVRLISRASGKIVLTDTGQLYLEYSQRILADLKEAEIAVGHVRGAAEGLLTILAPQSFGVFHFADAVAAFALLHPKIRIRFMLDDAAARKLNFEANDFDVIIRLAPLSDESTAVVRKIGTLDWVVCAAPGYLRGWRLPTSPSDLMEHNCLQFLSAATSSTWQFGSGNQRESIRVSGDFSSNSLLAIRRAVIAGVGIAQLPTYFIAQDLADGTLKELSIKPGLVQRPIYANLPGRRHTPKRAQLFVNFVAQWYRKHKAQTLIPPL